MTHRPRPSLSHPDHCDVCGRLLVYVQAREFVAGHLRHAPQMPWRAHALTCPFRGDDRMRLPA